MGRRVEVERNGGGGWLTGAQRRELRAGPRFATAGALREPLFEVDGAPSTFASEEAREAAWDEHRDALIAEASYRGKAGHRPWAYWRYDADREELSSPRKELQPEQVRTLVERCELTGRELAHLHTRGLEARARIGTPAEQVWLTGGGPDQVDAQVADLIEEAAHGRR